MDQSQMKLPVDYNSLTPFERRDVRNQYVEEQNGKCWFCKAQLISDPSDAVVNKKINRKLFPKNFFKWPIHLHHNHDTGMTIGAVHAKCNAVLWQYYNE